MAAIVYHQIPHQQVQDYNYTIIVYRIIIDTTETATAESFDGKTLHVIVITVVIVLVLVIIVIIVTIIGNRYPYYAFLLSTAFNCSNMYNDGKAGQLR